MGIPTYFRNILKKNRKIVSDKSAFPTDYFFIDFNSLVYHEWAIIEQKNEHHLIQKVIDRIRTMTVQLIKPKGYVYIAMDGPAPRAKMVQQRSRRYKSLLLKSFSGEKEEWDASANISPGTEFMAKMSIQLQTAMKNHVFSPYQVILNDSNFPGEGEHKFLNRLRVLHRDDPEKTVVIYSPDNDMISLTLLTKKSKSFILRFVDPKNELESHVHHSEYLFIDLDKLRFDFHSDMTRSDPSVDTDHILLDYNLLLSLTGNDFISSVPFLKIRHGGLDRLIQIYNDVRKRLNHYLVEDNKIHQVFLEELMLELAKIENREMRSEFLMMERESQGIQHKRRLESEILMNEKEVLMSRLQHLCFFHPDHPLFSKYGSLYKKIDYTKEKHDWKAQYYEYFFGIDPADTHHYNEQRTNIVIAYLKSIHFTMLYYTKGVPSWTWFYPYRVAPIPSDVFTVLRKLRFDMNAKISFDKDEPFTPFEQLCFILPPSKIKKLLPNPYHAILSEFPFYFVDEFEVDALAGVKFIYSEALLPHDPVLEKEMLRSIQQKESMLNETEKQRNRIIKTVYRTKSY